MPIIEKRLQLSLSRIEKFVNFGKRRLRGFASTDSVDRVGDVVVPGGGEWTLPLPLLWQHQHDVPVGLVQSIEPRGRGLWAEASVAEGVGKADETWAMVEAGLINAFSIGFRAIKSEPMASGGLRFTRWELYEVSLVTIPANQDAKIQRDAAGIPLTRSGGAVRLTRSGGAVRLTRSGGAVRLTRVVGGGAVPLTR